MNIRSLRMRLTLMNVLVLAGTLALCGVGMRYVVRTGQLGQIDEDLYRDAQRFRHISALLKEMERRPTGEQDLAIDRMHGVLSGSQKETIQNDDMRPPRLLNLQGNSVLSSPTRPGTNSVPYDLSSFQAATSGKTDYRTILLSGSQWRLLSYPVLQGGKVNYVLQLVLPMDRIDSSLRHVNGVLIHLIPLALIFAVVGGAFLTGRSLRPVGSLAKAAESISAENLSQRLPVQGHDEIARMATVFNEMLSRLARAFEDQGRFIADASHELRTPLTALKVNTSLALAGPHTADDYRTALISADKAADRLTRLVNDLLFLSRSDARQIEIRKEAVCISDSISAAASMFESEAKQEGVVLTQDIDPRLSIQTDSDYLERLLTNLISNAIRNTPEGGSVTIQAIEKDDVVEITITDTGCGISPEHLPHIFERFYRVEAARSRTSGGAGLGLAISRSIAESLGGSVEIASEVGKGTVATIRLPKS